MNQLPQPEQGGDSKSSDRSKKPDSNIPDKVVTADLGRFSSGSSPSVSRNMLHYIEACTESDPVLQAWHIDQIYDDSKDNINELGSNLSEVFYQELNPKVRAAALHALYRVDAPCLKSCLQDALLHPAAELVQSATEILSDHKDLIPQLRNSLKTALEIEIGNGVWDSPTTSLRATEVLKLCKFNERAAKDLRKDVIELLLRFDQIPIELAVDVLELANPKKSIKELTRRMLSSEESDVVRDRAERALKYFSREHDTFIVNQMHAKLSNKALLDDSKVTNDIEEQINIQG
jgi:hypothetical protein